MKVKHTNVLLIDSPPASAVRKKKFLEKNVNPFFRAWHCGSRAAALDFIKKKKNRVNVIVLGLFLEEEK